jgi:branched-chain amino acid aminotransferase/4-amino-4-deoxychorismate lyase
MSELEHDRGLLLGDGVFETLLALDGDPVDWAAHLQRMTAACARLGLPPPDPAAARAAAAAALADAPTRAALRLTLTAGGGGRGLDRPEPPQPRLLAAASAAPEPGGTCSLAVSSVRRNSGSPASRLKTLSYLDNVLARREARARGADEALLLNERGELACAAAANLFWVKHEVLFTPALDCGVLDGIVRGRVIAWARAEGRGVEEARAGPEALAGADAVFLTNSLIGARRVVAVDGRAVGGAAYVEQILPAATGVPIGSATRSTF